MPSGPSPSGPSPSGPSFRRTVCALAIGQLLTWAALYYAFASFVLPMQAELGWSRSSLMGAYTFGLAVFGAASFGVGAAIDRGQGQAVMTWAAALGGLGFIAWSWVSAPWMLYAVWAVLGLAMAGSLYEPAFAVLTKRYPERYRQGITALTLVGGFASTLAFPAIALLLRWLDWRDALVWIGVVLLAVAPLHHWALRGPALRSAAHASDAAADATLGQALRQRSFWLLTLCFTLYALVQAALWAHVVAIFAAKGVRQADAMTVLVCIGPAQVLGRLGFVWLGRDWSLRRLGAVVLAGLPLSMLLFALGRSLPMLLAFALLFGIANGLVTIVRGGLVPEYFGRSHIGRISGLMSGIGLFARAGGPLLMAWLLVWLPDYEDMLLWLCLLGGLAVLAFWFARPPQSPH